MNISEIDRKIASADNFEDLKDVIDLMAGHSEKRKSKKAKVDDKKKAEIKREEAMLSKIEVEEKSVSDELKSTEIIKEEEKNDKSVGKEFSEQENLSDYFDYCVKRDGKKERKQEIIEALKKKSKTVPPTIYYDGETGMYSLYLGKTFLKSIEPVDILLEDRKRIAENLDKRLNTEKKGKNVDFSVYMLLNGYDKRFHTASTLSYLAQIMDMKGTRCDVRVNYDLSNSHKNKNLSSDMKDIIEKYAIIHKEHGIGTIIREKRESIEYEL